MGTPQLFKHSIAKSISRIANTSEQKVLDILKTTRVSSNYKFRIPIPRLTTKESNTIAYCQELAGKV